MRHFLLTLLSIFFLLNLTFASPSNSPTNSEEENVIPPKPVETAFQQIEIEGEKVFALSYKNHPHWHTYWVNPGDAGLPTEIKPKNFEIEEYPWPVPKRFIEKGDILAYGYDGTYTRFFKIKSQESNDLEFTSTWLVCKHVCIPGKVDVTAKVENGNLLETSSNDFSLDSDTLRKAFDELPQKIEWPATLDLVLKKGEKENTLMAYFSTANPGGKSLPLQLGMLTPFRNDLLDITREKLYRNAQGTLFGKIQMAWDGEYAEPPRPFPTKGELNPPITLKFLYQNPTDGKVSLIEKAFKTFDKVGADVNESLLGTMTFIKPQTT